MHKVLRESARELQEAVTRQFGIVGLKTCELADFEDALFHALHQAATVLDSEYGRVRLQDTQQSTRNILGASLASIGAPQTLIDAIAGEEAVEEGDEGGEVKEAVEGDKAIWWEVSKP